MDVPGIGRRTAPASEGQTWAPSDCEAVGAAVGRSGSARVSAEGSSGGLLRLNGASQPEPDKGVTADQINLDCKLTDCTFAVPK